MLTERTCTFDNLCVPERGKDASTLGSGSPFCGGCGVNFYFLLFLLLLPSLGKAQANEIDSLKRVIAVQTGQEKLDAYKMLTRHSFDIAGKEEMLQMLGDYTAEAQRQKDVKSECYARMYVIMTCDVHDDMEAFLEHYPAFMAFAGENRLWEWYYYIWGRKVERLTINEQKFDEALEELNTMYAHAQKAASSEGMALATDAIGRTYTHLGRYEDSEKWFIQALDMYLVGKNYGGASDALYNLVSAQMQLEKFDETFASLVKWEEVQALRNKELGMFDWSDLSRIHYSYADMYSRMERYEDAGRYLNKMGEYLHLLPSSEKGRYLYARFHNYDRQDKAEEALAVADTLLPLMQELGFKRVVTDIKMHKARLLALAGRPVTEVVELYRQFIVEKDSLHTVEISAQLDELRTQYEVDRHIAEKQRNRNYFLFALGGCLLLALALGIWIYHDRTVMRKNRGLYRQIKEQDSLKEELAQMTRLYESLSPSISLSAEAKAEAEKKLPGNRQQRILTARLNEYLLRDRNFAQSDINLDRVVSKLATNRSYLFEAVKAVTGKTPAEYVHILQLEESKRMLETRHDLTIETIAADCGFNNRQTYYRLFREQYNITPAEYRKMAPEKS
ncbi:MAG: helix-turn-helix transcriptional regulator [Bacteroidales bacterium]|jgi:AraC-like DNA-binding protein|nr:helix-turn-helix transcriptional regulator [Bacteroidales bacterium]